MKKVILIPDSFKGTMSSSRIISIMRESILSFFPDISVISIPVADGGEGTVDAFLTACGGRKVSVRVHGPWNEETESFYGMLDDGTAIIEMAAAAGLPLAGERKDPSATTTYGVGELIRHAAADGARRIVLGLGGSATNDAGCGAAAACGIVFTDGNGKSFIPTGATLCDVAGIDTSSLLPEIREIPIAVMCDIDNPFYGSTGAAAVFAPQKGADEAMVGMLDRNMMHLAAVIERDTGTDVQKISGSGAAGGMGGGMKAFFGAELQMGIDTVLDITDFSRLAADADLIFTGEGKIDSQSLRGKVVSGVAGRAKELSVPVIAIVGDVGDKISGVYDQGVSAVFSINRVALPFSKMKSRAESDLRQTMDDIMRLILILEKQ